MAFPPTLGSFSNRTGTSVNDGACIIKQLAWPMAERQIGYRKSSLVLSVRFPVVKWRSRSVAKWTNYNKEKGHTRCPSALPNAKRHQESQHINGEYIKERTTNSPREVVMVLSDRYLRSDMSCYLWCWYQNFAYECHFWRVSTLSHDLLSENLVPVF